ELVAGQNPNTDTGSHKARQTWNHQWSPGTVSDVSVGYDRLTSMLTTEKNAVGPLVTISGLDPLGPQAIIPIDRTGNQCRYAALSRSVRGRHTTTAGFDLLRRQLNGIETDAHRGVIAFGNDFGRDAITNLRMGTPTQYIVAIGDTSRGFRNWDMQ